MARFTQTPQSKAYANIMMNPIRYKNILLTSILLNIILLGYIIHG